MAKKNVDDPELIVVRHNDETPWKTWQKIVFRFCFWFFGLTSIMAWQLDTFFAYSTINQKGFDIEAMYKPFTGTFYWFDKYIFHTGYNPKIHESFPEDNHYGSVFYLTIFLISVIATIICSIIDRNKSNYNRLYFWFCIFLRYTLAVTIIGYGLDKFIPVQMQWPPVATMLSNFGQLSRFNVLWRFMGVSPGYMMLTGAAEIIAGLLLLYRRTILAGYLLLLGILVNVVALNWFYNVPVKMFSAQLMVYNLFLLVPYCKELVQFFFMGDLKKTTIRHFTFNTAWKKHSITSILVLIPLLFIILVAIGDLRRYDKEEADRKSEKMYDVVTFIAKDTLPPLITDTLRWKRLLIRGNHAIVCNMMDVYDYYDFDKDTIKKTITLHDNPDKKTWKLFHYTYPAKDKFQLIGKWKGKDIYVLMKSTPIDSIPLNKEKIKLIQD